MYEYSNMCVSYIKESNGKKRKKKKGLLSYILGCCFFDLVFIQDATLCRKIREALPPEIISSLNDLQPSKYDLTVPLLQSET